MEELTEALCSMLSSVLDSGFELPVHVAVIGCNGAFTTATYSRRGDGLAATIHSTTGGGVKLPANVVFVDSRGEAAQMVIEKSGVHPPIGHSEGRLLSPLLASRSSRNRVAPLIIGPQIGRMSSPGSQYVRGALYGLAAVNIWAAFLVVSRLGVRTTLTPWDIAAIRFTVAGLLLLPYLVSKASRVIASAGSGLSRL